MKIFILGGYGVFGGRLIQLLADIDALEVFVAGRNLSKAENFCNSMPANAALIPVEVDRNDIAAALDRYRPDILVDASGPFQNYGSDPYHVIRACLSSEVHYLDFADAADFVFGVPAFDKDAKDKGIVILSGVSSFPVLTAAVIAEMQKHMQVETVTGGIAPSPYAGIGMNVMKAVVSYAGGLVKLKRGGQMIDARGLTESNRYTIAPPGRLPLKNLRFSLVDVPDLQVIPAENPQITDIWMGAGPVPESLHRILNLLAKLRAALRLPSFEVFSPLFYRVLNMMKFGEHRGGMFVAVTGTSGGAPAARSWHLLAEGDDGPLIPSMAIEAVLRKWLGGTPPKPGARAATSALSLKDYEDLFQSRTIYSGMRNDLDAGDGLYRQILGSAYDDLPAQIKRLHDVDGPLSWSGTARVERGQGPLSKLFARLFGFPNAADAVPVTVTFAKDAQGETWTRRFGSQTFSSYQAKGNGRNAHLLTERFGAITVALALFVKDQKLFLIPRKASFFGLPLPRAVLPRGESFESAESNAFNFNVIIKLPIIGLLVAYQGQLRPE